MQNIQRKTRHASTSGERTHSTLSTSASASSFIGANSKSALRQERSLAALVALNTRTSWFSVFVKVCFSCQISCSAGGPGNCVSPGYAVATGRISINILSPIGSNFCPVDRQCCSPIRMVASCAEGCSIYPPTLRCLRRQQEEFTCRI